MAAADHLDADPVARLALGDGVGELRRGIERLAVEGHDRVAADEDGLAVGRHLVGGGLQPGARGRAAADDACAIATPWRGIPRTSLLMPGGIVSTWRPIQRVLDVPLAISCWATERAVSLGIAKPTPTLASTVPPWIWALTPIDVAGGVEQRAAGVAVVDRRVGLDRVRDREPVGCLDVAPDGAHDPGGHRAVEPERVADRVDRVAGLRRRRAVERERVERRRRRETRTTARSLDGSAPTTVAGYVAPPPKPTRIPDPPATTWSLVRMSPRWSITKPEPSDCTFSVLGGVKKVGATFWVSVAVMTTTPGASRRYSAAGVVDGVDRRRGRVLRHRRDLVESRRRRGRRRHRRRRHRGPR